MTNIESNKEMVYYELNFFFSRIPREHLEKILDNCINCSAFHNTLYNRANRLVNAYIRHEMTQYEYMLEGGISKELARSIVQKHIERIRKEWGYNPSKRLSKENIKKFKERALEKIQRKELNNRK